MPGRTTYQYALILSLISIVGASIYAQEVEIKSSGLISQVKDPVNAQDAATKAYVDNILIAFGRSLGPTGIQGLIDIGLTPLALMEQGLDSTELIGVKYAGGIIFYLRKDGTGLVAAESDQAPGVAWGCFGTSLPGAQGTAIGTGLQNSMDIVASCATVGIAAEICLNLDLNTFDDWFLPSRNALREMHLTIGQAASGPNNNIGAFINDFYWSSSEIDANSSWGRRFSDGFQINVSKQGPAAVRAIRAF